MKRLYLRWAGLVVVGLSLAILTLRHYESAIKPLAPDALFHAPPRQSARVIGIVEAGSLEGASFVLLGRTARLAVRYTGPAHHALRELKTLTVEGRLDPVSRTFHAHRIFPPPHYGFIAAAYLLTLVPLGLFLFMMEQRLAMLYNEIKHTKAYEWEDEIGSSG